MTRLLPTLLSTLLLAAPGTLRADEDPITLMLQARGLQRRNGGDDPDKAVALYRRVLTLLPQSAEAHLRLSEALAESGDLEAAAVSAAKAAELAPRSGEAWSILGVIHYLRGRTDEKAWDQAKTALERATRLIPSDPELLMRLAEVSETRKDDLGAADAWLRLGRLRSGHVFQGRALTDIAYERAAILGSKVKRFEIRRESLLALVKRPSPDARHLRMLEELARDQVEQGYLAHAEESFRLLGEHVPKEPAVFENIAVVQLQTSRFAEALETLQQAEGLRPTPGIGFNIGLCLLRLGRYREAEARWQAVLDTLDSKTEGIPDAASLKGRTRVLLATALLLEGRSREVIAALQDWGNADPDQASLKVQALVQQGQWKPARAALKEGMARWPQQGIFLLAGAVPAKVLDAGLFGGKAMRETLVQLDREMMASLLAENQQWEACLTRVVEARKAAPVRDVELLLLQANALEQLGRPMEAMAVLREGQRLAPNHAVLQNNLGYLILEQKGDIQEASRLIEASLRQDPASGSTQDSWGWALFRQGRFKEAEEALRKAVTQSPFSPEIRRHFGEALLKLGRLEEALEQWERALAYIFPGRKALEEKVRDLRLEIGKRRTATQPDVAAPVDDDPDEEMP